MSFSLLVAFPIGETSSVSRSVAEDFDPGVACDRVASIRGSDDGPGTLSAPFAGVQKLVDSLQPGERGCLRSGEYAGPVKVRVGGTADRPTVLTSYSGESAGISGRFWLASGADHVTVSGLRLDGENPANLPSPTINASYASLIGNDITTNDTAICVMLGSAWGSADHALVQGNRIHDCGRPKPDTNHEHGIYAAITSDSEIAYNLIYRNADRGIQLFPKADRLRIHHNVIDRNGEGIVFSGEGNDASSYNRIERTLITNSRTRHNVESYYPVGTLPGVGNTVRRGCIHGARLDKANGGIETPEVGFRAIDNRNVAPRYRDPAAGDYSLASGPCRRLVGDIQRRVGSPSRPPGAVPGGFGTGARRVSTKKAERM